MPTKAQIMQIGMSLKNPALTARMMKDYNARQSCHRKPPEVKCGEGFTYTQQRNGDGWVVRYFYHGRPHRTSHWNAEGWLHRTDGPALIWEEGSEGWYIDGRLHRDGGPALDIKGYEAIRAFTNGRPRYLAIWEDRDRKRFSYMLPAKRYYQHGRLHRLDGPAIIRYDGVQVWCVNGQEHRDGDKPSRRGGDYLRWCMRGQIHRADGPAILKKNGDQEFWFEGKRHNEKGPAVITKAYEAWFLYGVFHREDGPAVVHLDKSQKDLYYVHGRQLTEQGYKMWQKKKYEGCNCGNDECEDCRDGRNAALITALQVTALQGCTCHGVPPASPSGSGFAPKNP